MPYGNNSSVSLTLIVLLVLFAGAFCQKTERRWQTKILSSGVPYIVNEKGRNYTRQTSVKIYSKEHPMNSGFVNATSMYDYVQKEWAIKVYNIPNNNNAKRRACFLTGSLVGHTEATVNKVLQDRNNKVINQTKNFINLYVVGNISLANLEAKYQLNTRFDYHCKAATDQAGVYRVNTMKNAAVTYKSLNVLGLIPDQTVDFPNSQHIKIHIPVGYDLTGGHNRNWPN